MSLFDATTAADVRAALAAGADIEQRGWYGETPLMAAVESHCVEAALALIAAGANVTSRSNRSTTALHVAATWSHEAVNALIKAGADVNARNEFNRTPIFYALDLGSLPLLLEAGADIEARDHLGRTPVVFAASFYDPRWSVVLAFIEHGADVSDSELLFRVVRRIT